MFCGFVADFCEQLSSFLMKLLWKCFDQEEPVLLVRGSKCLSSSKKVCNTHIHTYLYIDAMH